LRRSDEPRPSKRAWTNYLPYDLIGTIGLFRTTSILAPLLVTAIIIGVFAFGVMMWAGSDHLLTWALWIAFFIVLALILLVYIGLLLVNPDRLQTEEYRLEQQRITTLIGDERHPGTTLIESSPLTSNSVIGVSK
jgi:hypothetical protein